MSDEMDKAAEDAERRFKESVGDLPSWWSSLAIAVFAMAMAYWAIQ